MTDSNHRTGGALSATERDGVQATFDRLSGSYYDVLGVARDCDRAALREAYFEQLERFKPDRFEGRDLGAYAMHVEAIAREVNLAFAVLGDPDRRARYDRRLGLVADLLVVDAPPRDRDSRTPMPSMPSRPDPRTPMPVAPARPDPRTPMPRHVRDVRTPPPMHVRDARTPMPAAPARPDPRTPMSMHVRDVRTPPPMHVRDVRTPPPMHARDLHNHNPPPAINRDTRTPMPVSPRHAHPERPPARSVTPQSPATPSPPPPAPPRAITPPTEHHAPGSVIPPRRGSYPPPAMQQRPASVPPPPMGGRPSTPPPSPAVQVPAGMALESLLRGRAETRSRDVQRTLDDLEVLIERAARNDEHAEIVKLLRHATTLRPDDASLKSRLARAEETFQDHEVQRLSNAARAAEKTQRWDQAGDLWAKVADLRPADAQAALHAAQSLCESGKDFSRAAEYARKSVRLAPDVIAAHICLTRIFFKAGRTASARSALETAAKIDPRNPEVVALGSKLRG